MKDDPDIQEAEEDLKEWISVVVAQIDVPHQRNETNLKIPLDIRGTVFQEKVWQALMEIPPGGNRKLCPAFPFPRTPQSSTCRGQGLCLQSFGSSGSMSPGHSWIRRTRRLQVG